MQNKGFKKPGISQWLAGHPGLSSAERERILADNENMVRNLKLLRLPEDRDFGSFDSIREAERAIPKSYRNTCLFIIRCPHRKTGLIQRKLFVPWKEVVEFVKQLPDGYKNYRLGIREVTPALYAGTIISSRNGDSVVIEFWKGKHLEMDHGDERTSFRGTYNDDPPHPRRFEWSDGCTKEMKLLMLRALRYLAPYGHYRLDRSLHVEFAYTEKGFRFIGLSFDPYWTERPDPHWKIPKKHELAQKA